MCCRGDKAILSSTLLFVFSHSDSCRHPPPLVRRRFFWRPHRRGEGSGLAPSVYVMGIGAKRHRGWRERKEGSCGVGG